MVTVVFLQKPCPVFKEFVASFHNTHFGYCIGSIFLPDGHDVLHSLIDSGFKTIFFDLVLMNLKTSPIEGRTASRN